ncbi:MAG: glycosyltransferase family 39 protein [Caldilineaceae bacterium]|nr:glycosyltransferase family 39 protein [Caldilineaceae bacterium]
MWKEPKIGASLIICCFLLLGVIYSFATPIFEASDELSHYPFVQHLAQGKGLPVQQPGQETYLRQEASQPPLYYALAAALTFWIDTSDLPEYLYLNPHAKLGVPLAQDNKNFVIRRKPATFPWRGTLLAVLVIRWFSLLMGAGTVLCTYWLVRRLIPDQPVLALGAMALNAFLPMFLFISASVNNDNLVVLLSSLSLLLLVRVAQEGSTRRELLVLGGLIGLASLSKLSGLALLPLAGLTLALPLIQELWTAGKSDDSVYWRALKRWFVDFGLLLLPALLIAGWWFGRNWQLYGDPTGLDMMLAVAGGRPEEFVLTDLLGEFQGFRINFWGLFGAVNVLMRPLWVYQLLDLFTLIAAVGLALWCWRLWRHHRPFAGLLFLIPAAWIGLEFVALVRWTSLTAASQGRLLFPTISAIFLLLTLGWSSWLPPRWRDIGIALPVAFLFLLAVSAPFTAILPTYPPPARQVVESVPPTAQSFHVNFGGQARLLAFEVDKELVYPGDTLKVTLYWLALAPMARDYSVFVQIFDGESYVGQSDSYPGGGSAPTTWWTPGQIIRDVHHIFMADNRPGLHPLWIAAGLYDYATGERPVATDGAGASVLYPVLTKLQSAGLPQVWKPENSLDISFGNQVRLLGYAAQDHLLRPGESWDFTLYWQATAPLDRDFTVFVHLIDEDGGVVAQGDGPPFLELYPTSQWMAGEILNNPRTLQIPLTAPAGKYRVLVGLYDPETGVRLPVFNAAGQATDNFALLASLDIQP